MRRDPSSNRTYGFPVSGFPSAGPHHRGHQGATPMPDAPPTAPQPDSPGNWPSPTGHSAVPGDAGEGCQSSLTQRPLAPAPLQGLPRYYGRIRLLAVRRRRLMHSPSGYPPGLFGGGTHMNTPSSGHDQISLGPSIALSDHADPKHPRSAAPDLAPYPSSGRCPVGRGRGFAVPTAARPDRRPPRVCVDFGLVVCLGALQTPPRGGRPALC